MTCQHADASPVGYTEAPIERADAAVAGLILFAGVHLRPKRGGRAELATAALTVLLPPAREPQNGELIPSPYQSVRPSN